MLAADDQFTVIEVSGASMLINGAQRDCCTTSNVSDLRVNVHLRVIFTLINSFRTFRRCISVDVVPAIIVPSYVRNVNRVACVTNGYDDHASVT